jgi:DNA invertase Pin-like site-specific DNA recombinase
VEVDRLGRNLSQLLQTAERLEKKGVRLKVITEHIDTTTPMGCFMFNVMGSFAQLEREMIQERTLAGLAAARERGRIGGRRRVFSAETLEEAKRLVADEAEGGEGLSIRLRLRGHLPPPASAPTPAHGRAWSCRP